MVRVIDSTTSTTAQGEQITVCHLGKFEFKDETLYFNTSPIELTFDGNTYYAVGNLGKIEDMTETDEVSARQVNVSLNLIDADMRTYASNLDYANRPATIYRAYLDSNYDIIGKTFGLVLWRNGQYNI